MQLFKATSRLRTVLTSCQKLETNHASIFHKT